MTSWTLQCFSSIFNNSTSLDGDNIILPTSILTDLTSNDEISSPYIFNITHDKTSQHITCVAIEFTNDTDIVYVPNWIMQNLFPLNDGDDVSISLDANISKQKCGLIKIQPHDSIFITLDDHKSILESSLMQYNTLTSGTSIIIKTNGIEFNIDIVEIEDESGVKQHNAYTIDTDIEVDFLPPLDYVELKPDHWPDSMNWPLEYGINIIEEIVGMPTKYILSNGIHVEGTNKPPTPPPIPAPAPPPPLPATRSAPGPSAPGPSANGHSEPHKSGFVPFSGKGNKLGN